MTLLQRARAVLRQSRDVCCVSHMRFIWGGWRMGRQQGKRFVYGHGTPIATAHPACPRCGCGPLPPHPPHPPLPLLLLLMMIRFREQGLLELLESVLLMTGAPYLQACLEALRNADSWQAAEGALFAVRAVSGPLRRQLGAGGGGGGGGGSLQVAELLGAIFHELCGDIGNSGGGSRSGGLAGALLASPHACATAASLVGAYAPWFDATPAAPLEGALRLLLHALCYQDSWGAAAAAFRALCTRCAGRLAAGGALSGLAGVAAGAVAPPPPGDGQPGACVPMPLHDRTAVVEGLARIAAMLPPAELQEAALALQAPHLARARAAAAACAAGAASKALLQQLAQELQLLAVLLRSTEAQGPPGPPPGMPAPPHPALVLLEAAWPVLSAVCEAPACRADEGIVDAVCEVYKVCLRVSVCCADAVMLLHHHGVVKRVGGRAGASM